jgi:hypothetical protein
MTPALLLALIEAVRFTAELAGRYGRGELTDDQARAEWTRLHRDITAANDLWERAGQPDQEATD